MLPLSATYGAHQEFIEDIRYEGPLNVYGYSKYLFDQVLRREMQSLKAPVIGLRYFNVYGPNEQHKGRMASVAFHQYFQYRRTGKVKLFEGCLGYGNGDHLATSFMLATSARSSCTSSTSPYQASITAAQVALSPLMTSPYSH